ncbi:MAG: DUF11 domain-containing protein [Cyanobacteria bacterium J06626_6]
MGKQAYFKILGGLAVLGCVGGLSTTAAQAEGSQDLVSSGGDRPYLEFRTDQNGNIPRRSIIKVYANSGETIDLGSSAVSVGSGIINYRDPSGTAGTCGTSGLIANRAEEVAGPGNGTGGTFIPCTVTVGSGQSGIWEIDFVSPDENNTDDNPSAIGGTANWAQPNIGVVSAWDVTVRSGAGTKIPGRVYANYYAFNIGSNGRSLSSRFTVLTREGYQYRVDLNGTDPFGFIFFANRNGFFDTMTGDSIFRSLQFEGSNPGQLPTGYSFQNPNDPDVGIYVTHKTFINTPDSSMPSSANSPTGFTWLYSLPVPPPIPSNVAFTGIEGTVGQAGTAPLGGTLTFDSTSQSAFSITLDLNQDGIYGNSNDRTFVGRSVFGANSVLWDGLDGNGVKVPASATPYNIRINQYAGEAHFPLIDAEQSNSGIVLQRLNQPAGPTSPADDPFNIYYDDRNTGTDYTVCASGETNTSPNTESNCYGGAPSPREALTGVNSSSGGHAFTSNFGNRRGIDTWVYYPSVDVDLAGGIVIREADLIVDKIVDLSTADPGEDLQYTVTVTNDGPSDEAGIRFEDVVPASINNVSWSCAITAGNGSCGDSNGNGNNIDTTLDLDNQAVATYTIDGTISTSASGIITNTAEVFRNLDITDPDDSNNRDSAVTVINTTPPPTGTICYAFADNGDQLVSVDINTGTAGQIGGTAGVPQIEAIAFWPAFPGTLYAADADSLGTLSTSTGTYSNLGLFGTGSGSNGNRTFNDVDSLAFNPFTGQLFGVEREGGGNEDLLIQIDPTTGSHVSNAFGAGIDYLVIDSESSTPFDDIDDIAFDPITGVLYGIANDGGNGDRLITIDITDGSTTSIGNFGVGDVEGLSTFNDGSLYATTGNNAPTNSHRNRFYSVNKASGTATEISHINLSGIRDYEGLACLTEDTNRITGTVFLDANTNAVLDGSESGTANAIVRLYRDINGNGTVDGSDILLASQASANPAGTFDFIVAANGGFVLDVDPATLPVDNNTFTTDNLETASFGSSFDVTDTGNDFGHFTNSNLALVKRITAINGARLTDSVDNPSDDNDNHPNWPAGTSGAGISTFLAGATERFVEPGDEVEYTIYYLATGNNPVTNVELCDRVPTGATYIAESMVFFTNSATSNLTDTNTDGDGAEFVASPSPTPGVPCPGSNDNGTVIVNLAPSPAQLPNATGPGTPTDAYGFIRFRVTVD